MKSTILIFILLILILFIFGCTSNQPANLENSNANLESCPDCEPTVCPECTPTIEYQDKIVETVKYQCYDGSIQSVLSNCPQIPEAKALAKIKEFTGSGDKVTDSFYLKTGFTKITATYTGGSNFITYLVNEAGTQMNIHNEIGEYSGELGTTINSSSTRMDCSRNIFWRLDYKN